MTSSNVATARSDIRKLLSMAKLIGPTFGDQAAQSSDFDGDCSSPPIIAASQGGLELLSGTYIVAGRPRSGKSVLARALFFALNGLALGTLVSGVKIHGVNVDITTDDDGTPVVNYECENSLALASLVVALVDLRKSIKYAYHNLADSAASCVAGFTAVLEPGAVPPPKDGNLYDASSVRGLFYAGETSSAIMRGLAMSPRVWVIDSLSNAISTLGRDVLGEESDVTYPRGLRRSELSAVLHLELAAQMLGRACVYTLNTGLMPAAPVLDGVVRGYADVANSSWLTSGVFALSSRSRGRTYQSAAVSKLALYCAMLLIAIEQGGVDPQSYSVAQVRFTQDRIIDTDIGGASPLPGLNLCVADSSRTNAATRFVGGIATDSQLS